MPKSFYTKIVGVTKENRQELIEETIEAGDDLELFRQPDNPYDRNAIAVGKYESDIIGYLSADVAAELAPKIDTGQLIEVKVAEVTGGDGDRSYGVNVEVTVYSPEESRELYQKYEQEHPQPPAPKPTTRAPIKPAQAKPRRKRPTWMVILLVAGLLFAYSFFSAAFQSTTGELGPILTGIALGIGSLAVSALMAYLLFFRK